MLVAIVSTLVGVVGAGIIALSVAYMDRRQNRQIELHRADSSVPLKPPPNFLRRALSRNVRNLARLYFVAAFLFNLKLLHTNLYAQGPVTRSDILFIVLDITGMFSAVLTAAFLEIMYAMLEIDKQRNDIIRKIIDDMDFLLEALKLLRKQSN